MTELNISNNEIGDDGVVPLSRMLEKNKAIRILDIQFNMLTRKGTKHLLTCLNNNVFITELYMDEREVNLGDMFVNTDTALEAIGSDVRERIDKLVKSNKNFQLVCNLCFFISSITYLIQQTKATRRQVEFVGATRPFPVLREHAHPRAIPRTGQYRLAQKQIAIHP